MLKPVFTPDDFTEERMCSCFLPESAMIRNLRERGFDIVDVEGEMFWEADGYYAYLDRGADVLAVAHLDSVYAPTSPIIWGNRLFSSAVDNRFGVYVILELLHAKGIVVDVLFTTNEESCASTARAFRPPQGKEYNWVVSFDRKGGNVALYQYQKTEGAWAIALERAGYSITRGTYSDICDMSHLGCKALNIGIGYCDYAHSISAWLDLDVAIEQLNRFKHFYDANYRRVFAHDPKIGFRFESLLLEMDVPSRRLRVEPENTLADLERSATSLTDKKRKRVGEEDCG